MRILIADFGMPFGLEKVKDNNTGEDYVLETPYFSPLGGSETSVILLAKGLANLGHSIVVLNTNTISSQNDKIVYANVMNFSDIAHDADLILLNRNIPNEIMPFIGNKPIYYWSHDAYDQQNVKWMMNKSAWENPISGIFCVSEWQKSTFINYLNVDKDNVRVLPNPIDTSLGMGHAVRDKNKLIFASIPYKGLEKLAKVFSMLKVRGYTDLQLHIYSSFGLYNRQQEDVQLTNVYSELHNLGNVFINKPISMKQLAFEFATSSYLIHPSTYHETFGRVFVEAMLNGCLPITVDNGANREVIPFIDCITTGKNISNSDTLKEFVDLIIKNLESENNNYSLRLKAVEYAKQFDYTKVAYKFLQLVGAI